MERTTQKTTLYPFKRPNGCRLQKNSIYRYADDFLIGIIGSKEDATQLKENLTIFLKEKLDLELSQEKTLITHSQKIGTISWIRYYNL